MVLSNHVVHVVVLADYKMSRNRPSKSTSSYRRVGPEIWSSLIVQNWRVMQGAHP